MATVLDELKTCWTTYILPNYPDTVTLSAAIDLTTMAPKASNDLIAQFLATMITEIRDSKTYGYTQTMSTAQKKSLYDEIDAVLTGVKANIDAIQAAVHTYYVSLP